MIMNMFDRFTFAVVVIFSVVSSGVQPISAAPDFTESRKFDPLVVPLLFKLPAEPTVRVGLATNASSVSITTNDASLVAVSPDEPPKMLASSKVTVSARVYRPPVFDVYYFDLTNYATAAEAEDAAKEVRDATGEKTQVRLDDKTNAYRIRVGERRETVEEANAFKADLSDKGFPTEIVTERIQQPSTDALALSKQLKTAGKSEVRSLIKTTAASQPTIAETAEINPNLREVIVSGEGAAAKFTSLKAVAFGALDEHSTPVKFNGKPYRGRIEVFVNSRGTLSVVNAVSLEDYLLGVVPNELSLPAIEAQKAQAVAARTYAVANINGFGSQGFDLLPTVRSQVYQGFSSETKTATQAVAETRGIVATYRSVPINAYYTSTCGGRTENSENIFDKAEPYLRGVECSLEGHRQFAPFTIKTVRSPAKLRDENNLELARLMSLFAVNGFQLSTAQMSDDWFEAEPTQSEMSNWLNQIAAKLGKTYPNVNKDSAKPLELARILAQMIYGDAYADTLLSEADINYQLAFDDAAAVPKERRPDVAILLRDGFLTLNADATLNPNRSFSRARMLHLIRQIYTKKKWLPTLQNGIAQPTEDGKLIIKNGKTNRTLIVRNDVFLFREFGGAMFPVRETALVGGETVNFQTNAAGEVVYLEIKPTQTTATAERNSSFTLWNVNLSPSAVQSRLSRYVRGIGSLIDVRVAARGFSRRAVDLEIVGTNGTFHLTGGKIRSALRLNEQLFVINKKYDNNGRATAYTFTGRGWGHGVGMCQYGAYGLAKMGVKYDEIIKHYYTGVDLTKAY